MGTTGSKVSKHYPDFESKLPSLEGKDVAITGCTSGTGLVTAKCAARKGAASILMLNRPSERAKAAEEAVKAEAGPQTTVETIPCDLQDMASVEKAAAAITKKYKKIDVLCNNAGVMALKDKATKDGYDVQMQTNHLSHFKLTSLLMPLLKAAPAARIVHHSSGARMGGPLKSEFFGPNGGNLGGDKGSMFFGGGQWERYHQTKLANYVMTSALADKLKGTTMIAACAAPGLADTSLQQTTNKDGGMGGAMWIMRFAQSGEDGSMPIINACFGEGVENGDFYEPGNSFGGLIKKFPLSGYALDDSQKSMLWEASEAACGKFEV